MMCTANFMASGRTAPMPHTGLNSQAVMLHNI